MAEARRVTGPNHRQSTREAIVHCGREPPGQRHDRERIDPDSFRTTAGNQAEASIALGQCCELERQLIIGGSRTRHTLAIGILKRWRGWDGRGEGGWPGPGVLFPGLHGLFLGCVGFGGCFWVFVVCLKLLFLWCFLLPGCFCRKTFMKRVDSLRWFPL
jgi:hypothetical protein